MQRLTWSPVEIDTEFAGMVADLPGTSRTFRARVFGRVHVTQSCWLWTGTLNDNGYGVVGRGVRGSGNVAAHRAVWEMLVGPIPEEMVFDHLCRNPPCVNPEHGEIVTLEENKRRGFGVSTLHRLRSTCRFGHQKDGVLGGRGGRESCRYCKTCARTKAQRRRVIA